METRLPLLFLRSNSTSLILSSAFVDPCFLTLDILAVCPPVRAEVEEKLDLENLEIDLGFMSFDSATPVSLATSGWAKKAC